MDLNHPLLASSDDPPPFPSSYPQFSRLDRSVLCSICKEPFTGPVSIPCGHSFCSQVSSSDLCTNYQLREQCIRSWLDSNKACPSCNEPATEGGVRRNRALEEITEAWDSARSADLTRIGDSADSQTNIGNPHNDKSKTAVTTRTSFQELLRFVETYS